MAFLLPGLRRGFMLSTPLILSAPLLVHSMRHQRPILCDSPDLRNSFVNGGETPVIKRSGAPNPRVIRQISTGSILGVLAGLGVSVFSKPLAILIGLGIVCVQVRVSFHFGIFISLAMLPCAYTTPMWEHAMLGAKGRISLSKASIVRPVYKV